jgi:hypothetical protein
MTLLSCIRFLVLGVICVFAGVPGDFLRGPGAWQLDLALARSVPLREQLQVHFRAEVFNLLNQANYASRDGLISAADFGKIYLPINTTPVGLGTPRQNAVRVEIRSLQ